MTQDTIQLIRESFAGVKAQQHIAALVFYQRLFELDPKLRPLFHTDIEVQSRKLIEMLAAAVGLLDRPEALRAALEQLGARHVGYGVEEKHYDTVGQALLDMLASVLGDAFNPATRSAWVALYTHIAATMQRGAKQFCPPSKAVAEV